MCEEYSGWTNRETWALMLWINNDEGLQGSLRENIAEYVGVFNEGALTYQVSGAIERWTESLFTRSGYCAEFGDVWPDTLSDIAEDIGSLYRINYLECAESMLSDMVEG